MKSHSKPSQRFPTSLLVPTEEIKLFHYMVSHIGDELLLIRKDATIAYANDAAVRGFGYSRESFLKKPVTRFLKETMSVSEWQNTYFEPFKKRNKTASFEIKRVTKNGEVQTIEVTAAFMRYGGEEYLLSIARDITLRRENEQKVRETDKMKALSLFVSGTAQEIKYPLQAVSSRVQQLLQKYKNRDFEYIGYNEFNNLMGTLESVNNQIRECCEITNKLLIFNRKKAGIRENTCDVNATIRNTARLFLPQLKVTNVDLRLTLAEGLPSVAMSDGEFQEIIANVTGNALQAMPSGGIYSIRTSAERNNRQVTIEFKDNGVGMSPEILTHVFEPFFTTKQIGPGKNSGLGLAIVYSIVKDRNGEVTIKSSQRQGTVVKITLPVSRKRPGRAR